MALPCMMHGQLRNAIFQDSLFYNEHLENSVGIEFSSFARNNEYFSGSQDGQTYLGFQLQTAFIHPINPNAELHLGAYIQQDYGQQSGISLWRPVATLWLKKHKHNFLIGTLKGSLNHQLIEPLYEVERQYYDRNENGLQWFRNTNKFFGDVWLNWEVNTNRNVPRQERFSVGANIQPKIKLGKKFEFRPQIQTLYQHSGPSNGASSLPLRSTINSAIGAELKIDSKHEWRLLSYFLDYRDLSINPSLSFLDGYGQYHSVQFSPHTNWDFMLNYWQGIEWIAPIGGAIYEAVNPFDRRFPVRNRSLLFLRTHFHKTLFDQIELDARFDPYYDFNLSEVELSFSLHLRFSGLFK